jgi:two-component system chemotaxis sensor kinase CheA
MTREEDRARQEFTSEAEELLETLSGDLSEVEAQGIEVRPELINKIFRGVHSLKGLAGMLGFQEISSLSHSLEDMLDRLRMGKIEINRVVIDLLYDAVDTLNRLVLSVRDPEMKGLIDMPALLARIHEIVTNQAAGSTEDPFANLLLDDQTKRSLTEYEEHRLLENVRSGKKVLSVAVTFDFSDFDERLRNLTAALNQSGEVISTLPAIDVSGGNGISFRLLYGTVLDDASVRAMAPEADITSVQKQSQRAPDPPRETAADGADDELTIRSISQTVRVDIGRLDNVMNIVGELFVEKTQLEALVRIVAAHNQTTGNELGKITRNLSRKLKELQGAVVEIRMVPVGQIFSKISRTARKVAREVGKNVELVFRGEETELDKMMAEELSDPLLHIIRNAIDHGIEPTQERRRQGKPDAGKIVITAYQKGNSVVIDITDDGRGINTVRVREVAIERGLIGKTESIDQARAFELLFTPGFSTATTVSGISGRGVGLDVVKKNLQELEGNVEIISEVGRGTTFRVVLPITLAIIQALIVRAGGERFAIPLTAVEESLRIWPRDVRTIERKEVLTLRQTTLPLLRLNDAFGLPDEARPESDAGKRFVVVTRSGDKVVGIVVDALVRQQEIVIKSVGDRIRTIPGIAGATEIGENEIILVIDIGSLVDHFGAAAREARGRVKEARVKGEG